MNFRNFLIVFYLLALPLMSKAQTDLKELSKALYDRKSFQISSTAPAETVFNLQFIKYLKLDKPDLEGVRMISDLKLLTDTENPDSSSIIKNLFAVNPGKIFRSNYSSDGVLPSDNVGYTFSMSLKDQNNTTDTLVVYNSRNGIIAYRKSDFNKRSLNIIEDEKSRAEIDQNKTYEELKVSIKGYEKNLFPQDSLFAIGVKYKILKDNGTINNNIREKHNLYTTAFFFSSSSDIVQLSNQIKSANAIESWRADSLWLIKGYSVKDLCGLQEVTTFYSSFESDIPFDTESAMEDVKQNKSRVKVYTNLDLLKDELPDIVVDRSTFSAKFIVNQGSVYLYVDERIFGERFEEGSTTKKFSFAKYNPNTIFLFRKSNDYLISLMGREVDSRVDEPSYFNYIKLDFEQNNEQRNLKWYNPNDRYASINDIRSRNYFSYPFVRVSSFGYNLDKNELKKKMVFTAMVRYQQSMESLMKEAEEAAEKEKLINQYAPKYGKTFVQQAFEGNIIVGMHEDLLPIPLKLWKLYKRTDFTGGYTLYLNSLLNSAKRLQVRVTNKKVSYISTW